MKTNEIITNYIIEKISSGNLKSWQKPFFSHKPKNIITGKEYKGINSLILGLSGKSGLFCTPKQAIENGFNFKGVKTIPVVFWKFFKNEKEEEKIIKNFKDKPEIKTVDNNRAYYSPNNDYINIPEKENFINSEMYYSTLFHELIHSTGHKKRLNRKGVNDIVSFGSDKYSEEELTAEIGASFFKQRIRNN
ncbi:MAG: zincin-like metallopeptidase domain-containing protein [Patescibacteria group bacterium]